LKGFLLGGLKMQVHVGAKLPIFLHGAFLVSSIDLQHNYFDLWPNKVGVMLKVSAAYQMLPCVFSFRGEKFLFVLPTTEVGRSGSMN
jgi:hypothetical protein